MAVKGTTFFPRTRIVRSLLNTNRKVRLSDWTELVPTVGWKRDK